MSNRRRELALLMVLMLLLLALASLAPSFFALQNLQSLMLDTLPTLVAALGMTLVIVSGQIDVSIGAQLAVCSVLCGAACKLGLPGACAALVTLVAGTAIGAMHAVLVHLLRAPSLLVTLASLALLREGLRLATAGQWVADLPVTFQWLGLGQANGAWVYASSVAALACTCGAFLRVTRPGRAIYAVGSDPEVARVLGARPERVRAACLIAMGAFAAMAAVLHATRYPTIAIETGIGFELQVIACVVIGGAAPSGGRGSVRGTVLGVATLATLGNALVFLRVDPAWEKALAGVILVVGVALDTRLAKPSSRHA